MRSGNQRSRLVLSALCFIGVSLAACSTSEFTGTTPAKQAPQATPVPTVPPGTPGGPGTTGTGTPTNPTNPIIMPTITTNTNYPTTYPSSIVFQPDNGSVFHIGDGNFQDSTCISRISGMELKGTAFVFEFTVQQDQTNADIQVQDLCGVDYARLNTATLSRNGQVIASYFLSPTGLLTAIFGGFHTGNVLLGAGTYQFRIDSPQNPANPDHDRDDFIIGKVVMYSSKPMVKGNTFAQ